MPFTGSDNTSDEDIVKWTKPLINNGDFEETIKELAEKLSSKTIEKFLEEVFNLVFERSEKATSWPSCSTSRCESQWLCGLVDIPKFWDFLAQIISPVLSSRAIRMSMLKESSADLMVGALSKRCAAGKYVAAVLHEMSKSGQSPVLELWRDSGLQWSDFIGEEASGVSVETFLADNKLVD